MRVSERRVYRIADIEVDTSQGCLRRSGQEHYLRKKTLQVLLYLLEQSHRSVTKEELMEISWKDTAVTDDALVRCIMEIRRACGDDPHHPRFVRTISKVGYRFLGPVEILELDGDGDQVPKRGAEPKPAHSKALSLRIKELHAVQIDVQEETPDAETEILAKPEPESFHRPAVRPFARLRLVVISVGTLLLTAALCLYLGYSLWHSDGPRADITLPQISGKKPIVVMYFDNRSGDLEMDWLRVGLTDMMITNLSRSKKLVVLGGQQLHVLLERIGHRSGDKIRLEEALEVAARSRAEAIVSGSFAKLGESVRIDVQINDGNSGQLLAAESLTVARPSQILTEVDILSLKLATHLGATRVEPDGKGSLADVMTSNLEAYRYYSLGVEKAEAYQNREAIELLERAIDLDPDFAMAYARIGYAYAVSWNLPDQARPYLELAFELSHRLTEKDRLYIQTWYSIANLDYPRAKQPLKRLIANYPSEVEAYVMLGRLLQGEEEYQEAIYSLKRGLIIDPEAPEIHKVLGMVYSELGRHADAIAAGQRYVALRPGEPNAYDSLGLAYQWAGMYGQAIEAYKRALELAPGFELVILHLGNVYFQLGRYDEAIRQYQRYVEVAPSDLERAGGLGRIVCVYWRKRDFDRAEKAARRELHYEETSVWNSLVLALNRRDFATADQLNARMAEFNRTSRGTRTSRRYLSFFLGYIDMKKGQTAEAIANYRKAIRHRPPIWAMDPYEDCLANAYLELGKLDEAIAEYQRILHVNPEYPLAHYHLGLARERKGEPGPARSELERFLDIWKNADPDIPEVLDAKRRLRGL